MAAYFKAANASWLWLVLRLYVGYQWLGSGWGKLTGGFDATNFLQGAIAKAEPASPGAKPLVQGWWADFLGRFALPNVELFNILVPVGEFLVGLALIVGFATIFAATMGMVMNFAFLLSGALSSNPNLLALEFILVAVGGAYAGYIGVDYWFRPLFRRLIAPRTEGPKVALKASA